MIQHTRGGRPYQVWTPSHKRVDYVRHLLTLVPYAMILVDQAERTDYAAVVPPAQLVTHPGLDRMPAIRNWVLDHATTKSVVCFDDDFRGAVSRTWQRPRKYTDPDVIRCIIESAVDVCHDLDKTLFTWTREQQVVWHNNGDPVSITFPISCGFVFHRGTHGQHMRFDEHIRSKGDLDMSFQAMLHDRVILLDRRWFMNFGVLLGEVGGEQARRTSATQAADELYIKQKWKGHAELGARAANYSPQARHGAKFVKKFVMRVKRRSPLGFRS